MIARRVAADDEDAVGVIEIFQFNRRRAAAGGGRQADAARLVAVEAAIVDVVRPVQASEELQPAHRA